MPKVSIIIATHDRPHLLRRAVKSAQAAGTEVEVIVVDDASSEETAEVCRKLSNIRYLRTEQNQGLGGARNLGILASTADFISFLDDDDLRLPSSLDIQLEALAADRAAGLVYGQVLIGDQNCIPAGKLYPACCPRGDVFWELLEQNFIPCPSVVFRRSCLYRVGLLSNSMPGIEDWDFWIRIAERYPIAAVEQPVAIYRRMISTSDQYTARAAEMVALIKRTHRQRWLALPRAANDDARKRRDARRRVSLNMASHLIWESGRAFLGGDFLSAQMNILAALRLCPIGIVHKMISPSSICHLARAFGMRLRANIIGRMALRKNSS